MPKARLESLSKSALLMVACDFDGTISPLVPIPQHAKMDPRCEAALVALATLPQTRVAIISGRDLAWLSGATASIPRAMRFGSHGVEEEGAAVEFVSTEGKEELAAKLDEVAARIKGCLVERKPYAVALHYRQVDESRGLEVMTAAETIAAGLAGVTLRSGSKVMEFCFSTADKGGAVRRARYRAGATHVVFLGDDTTDEDAFAALEAYDTGIKVGEGDTGAANRVRGVDDVAEFLEELLRLRRAWLESRRLVPIERHSILSDQRTIAVVTPGARIAWMCLPRLDSPAFFGELLGGPEAGCFVIEAESGAAPIGQEYVENSLVLRTRWETFTLTDYLDCSGGRAYQRAGRSDLMRVLEGSGKVRVVFAPRPDFGRGETTMTVREEGVELSGVSEPCVLRAPGVAWSLVQRETKHMTAEAVVDLDAMGGRAVLELRFGTANMKDGVVAESSRRTQTQRHWSGWLGTLLLPQRYREHVARAALTIRALCNGPSGAIAAAGTTSLPEQLGGVRNWDYRFCWPRDACMAASALLRLGNTGHAMKMTEWLVGIVDRLESPERFRPIYTVAGEDLGAEAEIGSLAGYACSKPVRVGNAAAQQVQLDVFGPVIDMVAGMTQRGVPVSPEAWRLVRSMVRAVEAKWREPDHGIWEIRGPRRHHVHSKVMCWHAVDRALVVHDAMMGRDHAGWRALRDEIAHEVLDRGRLQKVFTAAYDAEDLDAAALVVGLTGLVDVKDPRWKATVEAIESHLLDGATVFRYRADDGLPGGEGGFVIAACWLVEAMVTLGRFDDARRLFERVLQQAGPTGLLAEQWDPQHGVALGNFPQVYSHLGVINAALALEAAEK
ncbi:MAG TPA: trehalose-phosphatase [Phycisphaerales bacterium]